LPSLARSPASKQRCFRPLGDQAALLLGERGVEVQHERIGVAAQFGEMNGTRCAMSPNERDIAREPVSFDTARCTWRFGGG